MKCLATHVNVSVLGAKSSSTRVSLDQLLLVKIANERFEVMTIFLNAITPRIFSQQLPLPRHGLPDPHQAKLVRRKIVEPFISHLLRLLESFVEASGDPGMLLP